MIEELISKTIDELGATGLLIVGLYHILYSPIKKMAEGITKMNHNSTKQLEEITKITKHLETSSIKENNKNNRTTEKT